MVKEKYGQLSVLHQNVQSISNKVVELDLVLKSSMGNIDVLCFTEHWVKEDYLNLIQIDQYKLVNYFSRKKYEHGGSCIYVKNGIRTRELNYLKDLNEEKEFEMSATELVDYGFIILCIYRPPDSNFQIFEKMLELVMQKTQSKKKKILMCGDWNLNFMVENKRTLEVKNLLESYNLTNIVRLPTRITPTSKSLIDVVIINKQYLKTEISVVEMGFSDHLAQVIRINTGNKKRKNTLVVRRHLTNRNIEAFTQLLAKESWNDVLNQSDVNASLKAFMDSFLYYFETAIPYKKKIIRNLENKKWLSMGLIISSRKMKWLNSLKKRITLKSETLDYIKNYNKIYKKILKQAKKRDNDRYVTEASNKIKAMWQLINKQIGKTQEEVKNFELRVGNNLVINPNEVTEILNGHFTNIMTELAKKSNIGWNNKISPKINKCVTSVFIYPVTEEEVVSLAKTLKNKQTAGPDDIPECLVKQCIESIKKPLTHIFNLSLSLGVFPENWKTAKITPLYKKGDRYDVQNYRPISIISVFAKLLERLICKRLMLFFQENGVLTETQYGFRKGKCLEIAVHAFIEKIQEALDNKVHSVGIFIDLTKAYDTLNHKILLEKLSSYGIRGITNLWFKSYLSNRRQYIEIKHSDSSNNNVRKIRSSYKEKKLGVPQGSVLGPLLFLLYTNDLPLNINEANLIMYADDINILIMDSDVSVLHRKIEKVIQDLEWWFNRNDLIINVKKTGIMSFHNRQVKVPKKPQVTLNGSPLEYVPDLKFLGIHITETLNWNIHLQTLAHKLSKLSFMIKSLKEILSPYMIRHIYFTKFQTILRSGILFWGGV
jgi:hypothetical protein